MCVYGGFVNVSLRYRDLAVDRVVSSAKMLSLPTKADLENTGACRRNNLDRESEKNVYIATILIRSQ